MPLFRTPTKRTGACSVRIPRIYTQSPLLANTELTLDAAPSHHILKVLRMNEGRPLVLFNGDGHQYAASIISATKKLATVKIDSAEYKPNASPLTTTLAIGLSKGDRFEWVLQKATELGVSTIHPLFTKRSEVKLSGERLAKKMASWQQVLISACEQCGRNTLPQLKPPIPLQPFIHDASSDVKFVLHHRSEKALDTIDKPSSATLLIGPEGGLSEEEITQSQAQGFLPLCLGHRVLRTETAPLAALSIMQHLWGDL